MLGKRFTVIALLAIFSLSALSCTRQQQSQLQALFKPQASTQVSSIRPACVKSVCSTRKWWTKKVAHKPVAPKPAAPNLFMQIATAIHNHPFLACTRAHESDNANGYAAYNPSGPWYGAYQFAQGTWDSTAIHAGVPQYAGVNILQVPGFVQDVLALHLYQWQGKSHWGGRC